MRSYTVGGSFGFHNAGDEIIIDSISNMLNEVNVSANLDVLSRFDKPDSSHVIGMAEHAKVNAVLNNPLIISGGGIIENKSTCVLLRLNDLIIKKLASKVSYLGVSVEPGVKYSLKNRIRIKKLLKRSSTGVVYTRDLVSEVTLRSTIKGIDVQTIGDLALWAKPLVSDKLLSYSFLSDKYIAISLCNTWKSNNNWYDWIAKELDNIHSMTGLSLVFVPMSSRFDDDRITHKLIYEKMKFKNAAYSIVDHLLPSEICNIYSKSSLVIASRLHSCVLAYSQKTPFVGISYHPKLIGFSHTVGNRGFVLPEVAPNIQSNGFYGYDFNSLKLNENDLVKISEKALCLFDFSMLDELKMKSLNSLRITLASFDF